MTRRRSIIPAAEFPAWQALGWVLVHPEHSVAYRGDGLHVLAEWEGVGEAPGP